MVARTETNISLSKTTKTSHFSVRSEGHQQTNGQMENTVTTPRLLDEKIRCTNSCITQQLVKCRSSNTAIVSNL